MQIGCVLRQMQPNGADRLIQYWAISLNDTEHAYDTTHRKYLEVVWAGILLQPHMEDSQFPNRTDHDVLKRILNLMDSTGASTIWPLRLSKLEFDVFHPVGKMHQVADTVLRKIQLELIKCRSTTKNRDSASLPPSPQNLKSIVMYMQDYDVVNDKEGMGIPAVHSIATSTDTEDYRRVVAAQVYVGPSERRSLSSSVINSRTAGLDI